MACDRDFKYRELARELEHEIRSNYASGDRFESEPRLCRRFQLNRETVHKAIVLLADQGLLIRKGRAGTLVGAHEQIGHDQRLICIAMAIRNHVWDQLFLSIANQGIEHERFSLICDYTGINRDNPWSQQQSLPVMATRLKNFLRFRPRTLVTPNAEVLDELPRTDRRRFRNLVLLNQSRRVAEFPVAYVYADQMAGWELLGQAARAAGYSRVCVFTVPGPIPASHRQEAVKRGGGYKIFRQLILREADPAWPAQLVEIARDSRAPLALLCDYDWGAHLAKEVLEKAGIRIPEQVGLFGKNNTAWSLIDDLTTVAFDPDEWAREIYRADAALEAGETLVDQPVLPGILQRSSSLPFSLPEPAAPTRE